MKLPNLAKAAGLSAAVLLAGAGVASAAVATASVNVRTGPGTNYRVVDTLRPGEQVAIVDRAGGWCAVQKSGPNGWVSCAYLTNATVRFRDYRDGPSVNLSFGFGVRPDRPRRPPQPDWWHNNHNHWDGPRVSGNSFSLSLGR